MENLTSTGDFHIMPFFSQSDYSWLIICIFFLLYTFGVLTNSIIIVVIYIDNQLHTPMYLFLCNLALVDICYTTTTVPKLLYMLLSGDNTMSFTQCFTQIFFYLSAAATEDLLILIMAYDRYVAICRPLHYYNILNWKNCLLLASVAWILGCVSSILLTMPVSHMSFCHSRIIHQFFCDAKALINISCGLSATFYITFYIQLIAVGFLPVTLCLISYVKIIRVILKIKSKDGRKKAFSTCSSHLITMITYYVAGVSVYMMPPSQHSNVLEPVLTSLYSFVTPMMNPVIYSLRNKDIKRSLKRIVRVKQKSSEICVHVIKNVEIL